MHLKMFRPQYHHVFTPFLTLVSKISMITEDYDYCWKMVFEFSVTHWPLGDAAVILKVYSQTWCHQAPNDDQFCIWHHQPHWVDNTLRFNSLRPCKPIWHHKSRSMLDQVTVALNKNTWSNLMLSWNKIPNINHRIVLESCAFKKIISLR